jgi:xanthine dehydrogenase YagR molybdenum-binding subunit
MAEIYTEGVALPKIPKPGEEPETWKETRVVGTNMPRVDAYERVAGTATFYDDLKLPGMLHGAILCCPHANAKVQKVDTSAAEKMPGVHAVITGESPEAKNFIPFGTWADPEAKRELFPAHCRYEGEPVAAVAAETPYQAWDAVRAIKVDYEVLPFVVDEMEALKSGAPEVREGGNKGKTEVYERGDINKGFTEADAVVEESYKAECQLHACPEPQGCAASWEGDNLTVWTGVQGAWAPTLPEISGALGLPISKCRVISWYNGGGFGGKTHTFMAHHIAPRLARMTGRPVKIALPAEQTVADGANAPPHNMKVKAGVKKDGTLTAYHYATINTGGNISSGGIFWYDRPYRDLYLCPNVRTEAQDVLINGPQSWPMRAPCHPQATWSMEQMMDQLAEKIGMDPVELRLKNIPTFAQDIEGNPPYTTTGLKECIAEGAEAFGWKEARKKAEATRNSHIRRGVGLSSGSFEMGFIWPPATPIVTLRADGTVHLSTGNTDIGTGNKTVQAMVIAEELGIKPEYIQFEWGDTGATQPSQVSAGSRSTPTDSPALREACIKVKQQLLDMAAKDLEVDASELTMVGGAVVSTKDPNKKVKIADVAGLKGQQAIVGVGHAGANPPGKRVKPFCAHFCEVEVNMKTMEVKVIRYLAVHDSGRIMSGYTATNQVHGGVVQGIGLALTEWRIFDKEHRGKSLTRNLHDYKIPTILDAPVDIPVKFVDLGDTFSSTGAKGLGEPPKVPPAAAVANAVYHATGIRFTRSAINPLQLKA